jgi:hypothetical protein
MINGVPGHSPTVDGCRRALPTVPWSQHEVVAAHIARTLAVAMPPADQRAHGHRPTSHRRDSANSIWGGAFPVSSGQRPYTRYVIEFCTRAEVHAEVARRFHEFRQLHAIIQPLCSPFAPLRMPAASEGFFDKNEPELLRHRAACLQSYMVDALRLSQRLRCPALTYALRGFLSPCGAGVLPPSHRPPPMRVPSAVSTLLRCVGRSVTAGPAPRPSTPPRRACCVGRREPAVSVVHDRWRPMIHDL